MALRANLAAFRGPRPRVGARLRRVRLCVPPLCNLYSALCTLFNQPSHLCTGLRPICTFALSLFRTPSPRVLRPRSPLHHITQPELMIPIGAGAERELVAEINQAGADFPLRAESNIQGVFW